MTIRIKMVALLCVFAFISGCDFASVGEPGTEPVNDGSVADTGDEKDAVKTIAELTENGDRIDGLFTLYRDREDGTLYMAVKPEQLDREYIYFSHATNGVVEAGYFRGAY